MGTIMPQAVLSLQTRSRRQPQLDDMKKGLVVVRCAEMTQRSIFLCLIRDHPL